MSVATVEELLNTIEVLADSVPAGFLAKHSTEVVEQVWVRMGRYSLKHGSFIDPSDLEVYGRQYYVPDAQQGKFACVEMGVGEPVPDDAQACTTVGDVRAFFEMAEDAPEATRLLRPSSTFELHGKLVKNWKMGISYALSDEADDAADPAASDVVGPVADSAAGSLAKSVLCLVFQ